MKTKSILIAAAVALAGIAGHAAALDFHGYVRTGIGGSWSGGVQQCFQAPNADFKFRLGNECETYLETAFDQTLYKDRSGTEFLFSARLGYKTAQSKDYEVLNGNPSPNEITVREVWGGAILPGLNRAMFWAGKRFYQRQDVHMIDFYYWDQSGPGAGLEDIDLKYFKGAVAAFQEKNGDRQIWRTDLRVYGVPVPGDLGSLAFGFNLFIDSSPAGSSPGASRSEVSPAFTLQHRYNLLGGRNNLTFQYGTGSATPLINYASWDKANGSGGNNCDANGVCTYGSSRQWRVVEDLVINPLDEFSMGFVFVYADYENRWSNNPADATATWNTAKQWAIGARPEYHLNELVSFAVEAGYQSLTPKSGPDQNARALFKATPAFIVHPSPGPGGAYFTRPELRIFLTYATWNDASQRDGIFGQNKCWDGMTPTTPSASAGVYSCDKHGMTFGAQMEAWW